MSEEYRYDLVCIGSGPAGQRAAVQAAKLGKRVAVIEKRQVVGGTCVNAGTIPSKTLREAVVHFSGGGSGFEMPGWRPFRERPSVGDLLAQVTRVVEVETRVIRDQLGRNGVVLIWGDASFKDPHTLTVETPDGWQEVTAGNVLVAVGTRASAPKGAEIDGEAVITSDGIVDMKVLPRQMCVVGAGVIGIEYASMFAALGVEVVLIEKRERPLEFLDTEIVDELMHQMRSHGVIFRLGETVSHLEVKRGPPRMSTVHLESGKRIVADMVLYSVGRTGATDMLNLAAAGLQADDRGRLVVDEHFRTSVPHIFAAGDVIGYPSLAATSSMQGRLAAANAFGIEAKTMPQHFPIGIYSIPEISMVGSPEHELTKNKIPYEVGIARYREIARGQILGDDSGFFKMLFSSDDRKLLGVHIIGTGATELLHIGQAVLGLGGGLDYFLETIFNYPTLAECYQVAALDAANKLAG